MLALELRRQARLDHAGVVEEPGQVRGAPRVALLRAEPRVGEAVREMQADRRRLGDEPVVVEQRRHLLVGVRVARIARARAVAAADRHVLDRVGLADFLEQPDDARRARLRRVVEGEHRVPPRPGSQCRGSAARRCCRKRRTAGSDSRPDRALVGRVGAGDVTARAPAGRRAPPSRAGSRAGARRPASASSASRPAAGPRVSRQRHGAVDRDDGRARQRQQRVVEALDRRPVRVAAAAPRDVRRLHRRLELIAADPADSAGAQEQLLRPPRSRRRPRRRDPGPPAARTRPARRAARPRRACA